VVVVHHAGHAIKPAEKGIRQQQQQQMNGHRCVGGGLCRWTWTSQSGQSSGGLSRSLSRTAVEIPPLQPVVLLNSTFLLWSLSTAHPTVNQSSSRATYFGCNSVWKRCVWVVLHTSSLCTLLLPSPRMLVSPVAVKLVLLHPPAGVTQQEPHGLPVPCAAPANTAGHPRQASDQTTPDNRKQPADQISLTANHT
jgi:hypothetical protein